MKNEPLLSIWIEAKQIIEPLCDGLPVLVAKEFIHEALEFTSCERAQRSSVRCCCYR